MRTRTRKSSRWILSYVQRRHSIRARGSSQLSRFILLSPSLFDPAGYPNIVYIYILTSILMVWSGQGWVRFGWQNGCTIRQRWESTYRFLISGSPVCGLSSFTSSSLSTFFHFLLSLSLSFSSFHSVHLRFYSIPIQSHIGVVETSLLLIRLLRKKANQALISSTYLGSQIGKKILLPSNYTRILRTPTNLPFLLLERLKLLWSKIKKSNYFNYYFNWIIE